MAGNIAAPLKGQEYQWIYGWFRCLQLLGPKRVVDVVRVEDPAAGSFDDVTVTPPPDIAAPAEFVQVKYHERQDECHSFSDHAKVKRGKKRILKIGLLYKAWDTWQLLREEHDEVILRLVSTWQWKTDDPVRPTDGKWPRDFVSGDVTGDALAARQRWSQALEGPDEEELAAFLGAMRFRLGYEDIDSLETACRDTMRIHGLRTDAVAFAMAITEVRKRVMERDAEVTLGTMESIIDELELRVEEPEPAVTLQLHTIRRQDWTVGMEDTGTVYQLDWCEVFEGPEHERGHELEDPEDWNAKLLPELQATAAEIETNETARLLRLRGFARLTPHVAAGWVFRRTAGWTIETRQAADYWRSDEPAADWAASIAEEDRDGDAGVLALAVAVSGDPTPAISRYLASNGEPAGRLTTIAVPEPGPENRSTGPDLVRLALDVKGYIQGLEERPRRLLLFYWGPLTGAVFIGHQLNATAPEIQLFEEQRGIYTPSMTLT